MSTLPNPQLMEKIVSLCKRRGFIFQSSEIYGGLNGLWDYGPLGVELKRNLKNYWWRVTVHERDNVVGMDGSILTAPAVLKASGHVEGFSDPMIDCRSCKARLRADQIINKKGEKQCPVCGGKDLTEPRAFNLMFKTRVGPVDPRWSGTAIFPVSLQGATGPAGPSQPTQPSTMTAGTTIVPASGPVVSAADETAIAYLRPETAQSIFVQFKNILDVSRKKLPFGTAQIGKALRNEINPRNFTFRSREFEQMELEFFIKPDEAVEAISGRVASSVEIGNRKSEIGNSDWGWEAWHKYWIEQRIRWYESIGLPRASLEQHWQKKDELAHYAKATVDILYKFPFGTQELEGIAARGDFDLVQHQKFSGKSMEYFDEEAKVKYVPHVIEPSAGVDRTVLALICNAYHEEQVPDEKGKSDTRVVLKFHPRVAPVKVAVFPLLKNRPELVAKAKQVRVLLRAHVPVFYDEA